MILRSILITGGAGYIGSHIGYLLFQRGYSIIILDSFIHNQSNNFPWATVIKADYANKTILKMIFTTYKISTVIHCAAIANTHQSIAQPLKFYDNNVTKTIELLNTLVTYEIPYFIFSSSSAVYGNSDHRSLKETDPLAPITPYGRTKAIIEAVLHDMDAAGLIRFIILRYFNVAGALHDKELGERHSSETDLIPLLLSEQTIKYQQPITIFDTQGTTPDGTCVRDFLHVWDVAHAHLKALGHLKKGLPSDIFNIGSGQGTSIVRIIALIEHITKTTITFKKSLKYTSVPPFLIADISHAQNILNWTPSYSEPEYIIRSAWIFEQIRQRRIKH